MASTQALPPTAAAPHPAAPPAAPHPAAPAVLLDGLTRSYRARSGTVEALRGVTHAFRTGTFTAIMGPSGSGKSTLLQLAAGLDRPTGGRVSIGGTDLGGLDQTGL